MSISFRFDIISANPSDWDEDCDKFIKILLNSEAVYQKSLYCDCKEIAIVT